MKFMPEPVRVATVGFTCKCSSSTWYSCHTQPTYTPVDASLLPSRLPFPSCIKGPSAWFTPCHCWVPCQCVACCWGLRRHFECLRVPRGLSYNGGKAYCKISGCSSLAFTTP